MRRIFFLLKDMGFSSTAKNTYILFAGNLVDAALAFLFTILVFRTLSTAEFGIFSALNNFVIVAYSLLDIGISGSLINFISYYQSRQQHQTAREYFQAGIWLRGVAALGVSLLVIGSSWIIGPKFFLTQQNPAV